MKEKEKVDKNNSPIQLDEIYVQRCDHQDSYCDRNMKSAHANMKCKSEKYSCWHLLNNFFFFYFDGIAFFGFADFKLRRLRGSPPSFFDRLFSPKFMLIKFGCLIVLIMILVSQISDYGKLKSQTTKLSERSDFEFNIQDEFPLMRIAYYYIHELIPHIR